MKTVYSLYRYTVDQEALIVLRAVTCEFTRVGAPFQSTVIPLPCVVNLNCNAIWALLHDLSHFPPLLNAVGSFGLCVLTQGPWRIHTQHTPASCPTRMRRLHVPRYCFCRDERESGLFFLASDWGSIWIRICLLSKLCRLTYQRCVLEFVPTNATKKNKGYEMWVNKARVHAHKDVGHTRTGRGNIGWLHPDLEFARKIEASTDK